MRITETLLKYMGARQAPGGAYELHPDDAAVEEGPTPARRLVLTLSPTRGPCGPCEPWLLHLRDGRKAAVSTVYQLLTAVLAHGWQAVEKATPGTQQQQQPAPPLPAGDPGAAEALEDALLAARRRLAAQDSAQRAGLAEVLGRVARLLSELEEERRGDVEDGEKGCDDPGPPPAPDVQAEVRQVKEAVDRVSRALEPLPVMATHTDVQKVRGDVEALRHAIEHLQGIASRVSADVSAARGTLGCVERKADEDRRRFWNAERWAAVYFLAGCLAWGAATATFCLALGR
jgi:hypothetical protein